MVSALDAKYDHSRFKSFLLVDIFTDIGNDIKICK